MKKYITVGTDNDTFIPVVDIYAFIYESEKGKTVLRATISGTVAGLDELKNWFSGKLPIVEYAEQIKHITPEENDGVGEDILVKEKSNVYRNFSKDLVCKYSVDKDEWSIEVTKKSDEEILAEINNEQILQGYMVLTELYEATLQ